MRDMEIINIIKDKILKDYKEDISMMVVYGTNSIEGDKRLGTRFYYVPKNEKGRNLSSQFIVDGVSYDLFPISWERLISNAAMDSPQGYLLLDTEIVYSSDEEAVNRFENLKVGLKELLQGERLDVLINKAYEYFNESYIYIFNMEKYKYSMDSVRMESAKLLNMIANALAFANSSYYSNGNGSVLRDSTKLKRLPEGYKELVEEIVFGDSYEQIYTNSTKLVENTRAFLLEIKKEQSQRESFEILFKGYYEELKKSIDKCRIALEKEDYYKLFELFAFITEEVAQFITKVEEGIWYDNRNALVEYNKYLNNILEKNLLDLVAHKDKNGIYKTLEDFEKNLVTLIEKNNVEICSFDSTEEFKSYFGKK